MEAFEGFAGRGGGWGVFNTEDETELSQIQFEFPLTPFPLVQVHPTGLFRRALLALRP
jgi:hypothetical protein